MFATMSFPDFETVPPRAPSMQNCRRIDAFDLESVLNVSNDSFCLSSISGLTSCGRGDGTGHGPGICISVRCVGVESRIIANPHPNTTANDTTNIAVKPRARCAGVSNFCALMKLDTPAQRALGFTAMLVVS